jgi:hypothetical protein
VLALAAIGELPHELDETRVNVAFSEKRRGESCMPGRVLQERPPNIGLCLARVIIVNEWAQQRHF